MHAGKRFFSVLPTEWSNLVVDTQVVGVQKNGNFIELTHNLPKKGFKCNFAVCIDYIV